METLRGQSPGCPSQGMAFCSPSSFRSGMVGGSDSARESPEITFLWDTGPQPGEISKGRGCLVGRDSQASPLDQPQASCGLQSGGRASLRVTAGAAW